jgi:hypothetical protein
MKEYIKLRNIGTRWSITYYKDQNNAIYHRENYKPTIIWNNGIKLYWKNGKLGGITGNFTDERIHHIN